MLLVAWFSFLFDCGVLESSLALPALSYPIIRFPMTKYEPQWLNSLNEHIHITLSILERT